MTALIEYKQEFYEFTALMIIKLQESEEKHKDDSLKYDDIKNHFVEEILECFNIRNTINGNIVRDILLDHPIDIEELVDVANLAFAVNLVSRK